MIEVVLRWAGDVVEVRRVDDKLSVGRLPSDDLFLPLDQVSSVDLVTKGEHGFLLASAPGMRGFVESNGERVDVAGAFTIVIDARTEARLECGPFTLEVRAARRFDLPMLAPLFDALWANTATASLAAMAAFVAIFTLTSSHDRDVDELPVNPAAYRAVIAHATPKSPSSSAALASDSASAPVAKARAHSTSSHRAPASRAPSSNSPRRSDREVVESKLALLFDTQGFGTLAGDSHFDETASLIGSIHGSRVGATGLAVVDAGHGGTGAATIGIGSVGTHGKGTGDSDYGEGSGDVGAHEDRDVVMVQNPPVIIGSLDREIIRRVVREHVSQVRACYERALIRDRGLDEKVAVKWVIASNGAVSSASLEGAVDELGTCVAHAVRTWKFPAPRGGGIVVVTYPFVLKRAG